jgi:putative DNA primase/helicase
MRDAIQDRAAGRWRGILSALGVPSQFLRNKHGPCPACGGNDRYRWDDKNGKGTFFCSHCGAGDGFDLLKILKGWDFRQAAEQVEAVVGAACAETPRKAVTAEELRAAMKRRWEACVPVEDGSAVARYLTSRGVYVPSKVIRAAPDRPAMVALMQAPDGRATMVHTTLLTSDGRKAAVAHPRLMMQGSIADGAAVRLFPHGDDLGIAEGLETAISATVLTDVPCWAALNEVCLRKWLPPAGVKRVIIFGDNDENYAGQAAAFHLARKIRSSSRTGEPPPPMVEVRIPPDVGDDWNSVRASTRSG